MSSSAQDRWKSSEPGAQLAHTSSRSGSHPRERERDEGSLRRSDARMHRVLSPHHARNFKKEKEGSRTELARGLARVGRKPSVGANQCFSPKPGGCRFEYCRPCWLNQTEPRTVEPFRPRDGLRVSPLKTPGNGLKLARTGGQRRAQHHEAAPHPRRDDESPSGPAGRPAYAGHANVGSAAQLVRDSRPAIRFWLTRTRSPCRGFAPR
jgi:hypothetical protein